MELTLREARAAIGGLRPPVLDDLGLAGGLASLARSIPQIEMEVDLADTRLAEHIELALYRIAQECLQNVVKHANATSARLTFAVGQRHRPTRNRRRRGRFRHLRASAGQRRDGRLRPAVDGRTGRTGRRAAEHPVASRFGHRRHGDDPAAVSRARDGTVPLQADAESHKSSTAHVRSVSLRSRRRGGAASRSTLASVRDSSSDIPMSAKTSLFSVTVASSTVERPRSVMRTRRGAPVGRMRDPFNQPVGLQPPNRMRDAGDVHLQPVGRLGDRQCAAAAERQQPQQLVSARSSGRRAAAPISTRASRIWCARITDVTATMPSATSPQPARSQLSRASAIGSAFSCGDGCEDTPLHTASPWRAEAIISAAPSARPRKAPPGLTAGCRR